MSKKDFIALANMIRRKQHRTDVCIHCGREIGDWREPIRR